ncbi:NAD(P)-dependent oxidoreductase [Castellaniella sp.]|uniref:NAD(P)-dependent oxidoreductase n=1 Tax=Castellaniella sp. TaxID=1955812 RepID=UPI00355D0ED5
MVQKTYETIGFIGTGHMGAPMASCLHRAGHALVLLDADRQAAQRLACELGGSVRVATTGAELAADCDLVITMLPTSAIVRAVLSGDEGVLSGLRPGTPVLDMTSGIPHETQRLSGEVERAGGILLDAPVSGGVARARAGELTIMVGGAAAWVEAVHPVLAAMGTQVLHVGATGSGHAMKALNNLVSAGGFLIGIEALMIGQRFGLDPGAMVDVLNASTGMNNSTQKKFRQYVLSRSFASGFGLDLMVKDLTIALSIATAEGTPAPFSALCRELWASGAGMLGPGQDHTAIARLVEALAHTELGVASQVDT